MHIGLVRWLAHVLDVVPEVVETQNTQYIEWTTGLIEEIQGFLHSGWDMRRPFI